MRTSSAIAFSLLAVSASPVFAAPVATSNAHSLEARGIVQMAGSVVDDIAIRIAGLSKTRLTSVFNKILGGNAAAATERELATAFKVGAKKPEGAMSFAFRNAKAAAVSNVHKTADDIAILKVFAKNKDPEALAALKSLSKPMQKQYGVGKILNPSHKGKIIALAAGAGLATFAAGSIVAEIVGKRIPVEANVANLPATVAGGAITEEDQQKILYAISQRPDDYPQIMEQIRQTPNITPAEIQLFESANPSGAVSVDSVATTEDGEASAAVVTDEEVVAADEKDALLDEKEAVVDEEAIPEAKRSLIDLD